MKILQIVPYSSLSMGGPISVVNELSRELSIRGHEITIASFCYEDKNDETDINNYDYNNIKYIKLKCVPIFFGNYSLSFIPYKNHQIRNLIKETDVVHFHEFRSPAYPKIIHVCLEYGKKIVIQAHGSVPISFPNQEPHMVAAKKLFDLLLKPLFVSSNIKYVALSESEKNQYEHFGVDTDDIHIIPNAINAKIDFPEIDIKQELSINGKYILYLGRLHKIKNLEVLIDAFLLLTKLYDDISLLIVGPDSGERNNLQRHIDLSNLSEKVKILHPIYGNKKFLVYKEAKMFVLPSLSEAFPVTALESMACGTPIVITNKCDLASVIHDSKAGYSAQPDMYSLFESMKRIICDEQIEEMQNNAIKLVNQKYSWNEVIKKYLDIYSQ